MSILVKLEAMHRHNGRERKPGDTVNLPNSMALAMKRTGGCTFVAGSELVKTREDRKVASKEKKQRRAAVKASKQKASK